MSTIDMSNVVSLKAPTAPRTKYLTPDETINVLRRAQGIVAAIRACIDHDEEPSAYALEAAEEMLEEVSDALDHFGTLLQPAEAPL